MRARNKAETSPDLSGSITNEFKNGPDQPRSRRKQINRSHTSNQGAADINICRRKRGDSSTYGEVAEVDGGPCGPGRAAGDGEDEEPCEEEEQDVGGPDPRVDEPLGILVQVHRRRRLHVVGRTSPPHPRPYPAAGSSDLGVSSDEVPVAGAGGRQRRFWFYWFGLGLDFFFHRQTWAVSYPQKLLTAILCRIFG